jgi:BirA family biotin operon repressor/biotin-[acetyl-CoA-carboxylase] ligase
VLFRSVCGIGVNVLPPRDELKSIACHISANRMLLATAVIDKFFEGYDMFVREGLKPFMDDFRRRSVLSGEVTVISPGGSEAGEFIGFDDTGALLLDCDGVLKRFVAGEVSLRGGGIYV